LDGPAAALVGQLRFASLGIAAPTQNALVTDDDLRQYVRRDADDHKWMHALGVLAGSPRMPGAATLVCRGALSAGASMVCLESRGRIAKGISLPPEIVRVKGPRLDSRYKCVVAGPGLGVDSGTWLRERLEDASIATVLDADALTPDVVALARGASRVLTPHEREFERLSGVRPGPRRIEAVRRLAAHSDCVVLLKGPTTIICSPAGDVRVVRSGTSALATAGTGDVLAGMIGAAVARGHEAIEAAALSAHLHGLAGAALPPFRGASALPGAVTTVLTSFITAR
jgi:NAD(P)H-hydrate epimerase